MLEFAAVITTGGLLLFSSALCIDNQVLMSVVGRIIDSKNLEANFIIQTLQINYLYDAILGLVFIIAWRKEIELEFPQKLLQSMSLEWKAVFPSIKWLNDVVLDAPSFEDSWQRAYDSWNEYVSKKERQGTVMGKFDKKEDKRQKKPKAEQVEKAEQCPSTHSPTKETAVKTQAEEEWENLSPRERFLKKQQESKKPKSPNISPKKEEEKRTWEDGRYSKKDLDGLDRSKASRDKSPKAPSQSAKYLSKEEDEKVTGFIDSDQEEVEDEKSSTFLNNWVNKFKNIVGDKIITRDDLTDVLADFKQKLMEKNVAQEVSIQISEAVGETLLRSKTKSFTSVHKTVKQAMKEALRKVLTPKRKIDLVVEVTKEREKLKPYVIVFVGVNGVGKSTNLAKVAYKLKNAKLSVMLAACDNFRAGAVEQIETHGRNLDIPVFQKGYKEEPANIAYEAIKDATKKRIDAVLVDTAGRMQDNTSLMKELANLVRMNKPNLVVFIGEALVGNDAVDQITKFNRALEEQATEAFKPQIDAILLSKFDTVDDKVGTALSLIYATSKPILYVGVGQKYPNLKELNVNTVVHSLLS